MTFDLTAAWAALRAVPITMRDNASWEGWCAALSKVEAAEAALAYKERELREVEVERDAFREGYERAMTTAADRQAALARVVALRSGGENWPDKKWTPAERERWLDGWDACHRAVRAIAAEVPRDQ